MNTAIETPDKLIPLNTAIRELIPGNKNPSTAWRWINRGLEGFDGNRIRLQVWYVGRQPHTTREAIQVFLNTVTAARLARMARTQEKQKDVTEAELNAAGLLRCRR
jgi:hypothetical protein